MLWQSRHVWTRTPLSVEPSHRAGGNLYAISLSDAIANISLTLDIISDGTIEIIVRDKADIAWMLLMRMSCRARDLASRLNVAYM